MSQRRSKLSMNQTELSGKCSNKKLRTLALVKTPVLTKSINIGIWIVGTSNQLIIKRSSIETKFTKR